MNAKPTALDVYLTRTAAIHAKLERLQQLADNHFGHAPDAIHWGHVGDLGRVEAGLESSCRSSAAMVSDDAHQPPEIDMTTQAKLTDTQTTILKAAVGRADGNLEPLPPTLRCRPKTVEDIFVAAANNWLVSYENLSGLRSLSG